jgi:hypothetical protein
MISVRVLKNSYSTPFIPQSSGIGKLGDTEYMLNSKSGIEVYLLTLSIPKPRMELG